MENDFHILSLSGGGFLGLYTISVLAALEKRCGVPIARKFDLLAGTSIGGITALGLAAEIPASRIREVFESNGILIFSNRSAPTSFIGSIVDLFRFATKPKYNTSTLRKIICDLVGEDTKIKDLLHPVIVPTVNLTKGTPQLFKTSHHKNFFTDLHQKVVDVALATAAAPGYFPIAEIGDSLFADGGLFANSPDILAVHEAEHFFQIPIENIYLLSIGTTTSKYSFAHDSGLNFGWINWMTNQRLISVIIASQQHSTDFIMKHRLGNRYLRLDESRSIEQNKYLGLDIATTNVQKTLRGLADSTVQARMNDPILNKFFSHTPAEPKFHNI